MSDSGTKRILLIEDDDGNAEMYTDWLTAQRYDVARAAAAEDGVQLAESFRHDVVVLDLQIPSKPGRANEHTSNGFYVLEALLKADPFRPIVVASAHSKSREVMQRNRGGQFIFEADKDLRASLLKAIAVALSSPAYRREHDPHL